MLGVSGDCALEAGFHERAFYGGDYATRIGVQRPPELRQPMPRLLNCGVHLGILAKI
jgi:hypothetical protein